jgi:hypothetical protein
LSIISGCWVVPHRWVHPHCSLSLFPPPPSLLFSLLFPPHHCSHACHGWAHPLLLLVPSSPSLSSCSVIIQSWSLLSPLLAPTIPHMSSCSPWQGRVLGWCCHSLLVLWCHCLVLVIILVTIVLSVLLLLSCHWCPVIGALSLSSSS